MYKFCEIEAEDFQVTFHGTFKSFKFLASWQAPGTQKADLTNQIRAQTTVL